MPDLKAIEDLLLKYDIKISSASYKAIEARKRYIPIKKNISEQTILKIKKDIKEERDKIFLINNLGGFSPVFILS